MSYAAPLSEKVLSKPEKPFQIIPNKSASKKSISTGQAKNHSRKNSPEESFEHRRKNFPIIVHCHLCWDWVWQRPQQFLSRLSQRHQILFVETVAPDPALESPVARFRTTEDLPNLTILRLQFPLSKWSDGKFVDQERRRLVREYLEGPGAGKFENPVQWFYDPMAVTAFAGQMEEILTVYDCMDELSKFKGAPPEIIQREAELLARADVVFTGGRKLFESKSRHHENCHFYGCGVDGDHFGRARSASTAVPLELATLAKPVLGYFGVIDERLDYDLIAALADANPKGSVAMVGPVIKVEESALPRRKNIHWLGQRAYNDLPSICKGFDVCLMPFALNEATEYINPTKALEYMATGRPIVSTAVADVVRNFGAVCQIARSPDEFMKLCRDAAEKPDRKRIEDGFKMVSENSWESIVDNLEKHIQDALEKIRTTAEVA